jgi:hypothetical protein
MARFSCDDCRTEGTFAPADVDDPCPYCGSKNVLISVTMEDFPAGHPLWAQLCGLENDVAAESASSGEEDECP